MRQRVAGVPLYTARAKRGVQKPRSRAPSRSSRYAWRVGQWIVFVSWERFLGFVPTSAWKMGSGYPGEVIDYPDVRTRSMKKWSAGAPAQKPEDAPAVTSTVLKKFPRLLAFLTDRWYDDGSPRFPGSIWFDSDLGACKAMLKEPSLMLCARIRAATVDDLYAAVETFLGLDSPPWEPDQFALDKAAQKKKK